MVLCKSAYRLIRTNMSCEKKRPRSDKSIRGFSMIKKNQKNVWVNYSEGTSRCHRSEGMVLASIQNLHR